MDWQRNDHLGWFYDGQVTVLNTGGKYDPPKTPGRPQPGQRTNRTGLSRRSVDWQRNHRLGWRGASLTLIRVADTTLSPIAGSYKHVQCTHSANSSQRSMDGRADDCLGWFEMVSALV